MRSWAGPRGAAPVNPWAYSAPLLTPGLLHSFQRLQRCFQRLLLPEGRRCADPRGLIHCFQRQRRGDTASVRTGTGVNLKRLAGAIVL